MVFTQVHVGKLAWRALAAWMAALVLAILGGAPAHAGLLADATRVIVRQGQTDASLVLANTNDYPVIVQTWVDRGEADPQVLAPFASVPSVFRLEPEARRGIRILLADAQALPEDRESVFWLNLYEIPPASHASGSAAPDRLALAMNTQLKIFYRPATLPNVDVPAQLRFTLVQEGETWFVECENPTLYHASFTTLEVVDGDAVMPVVGEMDMMTAPFSQRRYVLGNRAPRGKTVRYALVDDAGFPQRFEAVLRR